MANAVYQIDPDLKGADRTKARKRAAYIANREKRIQQAKKYRFINADKISKSRKQKYVENKDVISARMAKYRESTRDVAKERTAKWRKENPEKLAASKLKYYEKNKDSILKKVSEYVKLNKEKLLAYRKRRYKEKYYLYVAASNERRAKKLQATVTWDKELTEFVTREAAKLVRLRFLLTGIKWHTDHIIPLRGKTVSGLHVWNNLQVIPAILNLKKGCKINF
jgi:hypothetical protein